LEELLNQGIDYGEAMDCLKSMYVNVEDGSLFDILILLIRFIILMKENKHFQKGVLSISLGKMSLK
jgi:hypothetical protein